MLTHDMQTPAAKQTAIVPVCPKCGIIGRSGKSSCCGRGGSWFGNCGSADNTKVEHRWYEGLEACKTRTQLKIANGRKSNVAQEVYNIGGGGMGNSNTVPKTFELTSINASSPAAPTASIHIHITTTATNMTTLTMQKTKVATDWISRGKYHSHNTP